MDHRKGIKIDDCKKTLEKLDKVVNDVQKESFFGRGFMRKPRAGLIPLWTSYDTFESPLRTR
jgi:hypothetical protein